MLTQVFQTPDQQKIHWKLLGYNYSICHKPDKEIELLMLYQGSYLTGNQAIFFSLTIQFLKEIKNGEDIKKIDP